MSYKDQEKLQALSAEISWSHNLALLSRCRNFPEKEFYMRMVQKNGWSYQTLLHYIELNAFIRVVCSQSPSEEPPSKPEANLAVEDDYSFGFLKEDKREAHCSDKD